MNANRLGTALKSVGGLVLIASLVWWGLAFRHYFEDFGVGRCLTCLYSDSDICRVGSGLVSLADGTPSYSPVVFWLAVGLLVLGFVVGLATGRAKE